MKIQTILSEGPFIQGQGRGSFTGGKFGQDTNHPAPKPAAPPTFQKKLYKGFKANSDTIQQLVGSTLTNRPRKSVSGTQITMRMYDELVLPNLPQLKGTAPRSNCLIGTFEWFTAMSFGDVAELEVVEATSKFAWTAADFNMINNIKQAVRMCELDAADRKAKDVVISELSEYTKQSILKQFSNLFDAGMMGVADNLQDVPSSAEEIWFAGTVKIVNIDDHE